MTGKNKVALAVELSICKNQAMLFHVDMIYLTKQAKRDVEKSFALRYEP